MDNYKVAVNYQVTKHSKYERNIGHIYQYDLQASLSFHNNDDCLILSQPLTDDMCQQILNLIDSNQSGDVLCSISLTELYINVENDILIIGVAYGGPSVRIKILPCLKIALLGMIHSYNDDLYKKKFTKKQQRDDYVKTWTVNYDNKVG